MVLKFPDFSERHMQWMLRQRARDDFMYNEWIDACMAKFELARMAGRKLALQASRPSMPRQGGVSHHYVFLTCCEVGFRPFDLKSNILLRI